MIAYMQKGVCHLLSALKDFCLFVCLSGFLSVAGTTASDLRSKTCHDVKTSFLPFFSFFRLHGITNWPDGG